MFLLSRRVQPQLNKRGLTFILDLPKAEIENN